MLWFYDKFEIIPLNIDNLDWGQFNSPMAMYCIMFFKMATVYLLCKLIELFFYEMWPWIEDNGILNTR